MISELRQQLISKKASALEVAKECLVKAKTLNEKYNSFLSFCDELAIESAKKVDKKIAKGDKVGKLAGITIALKDNILVSGYPATAASHILEQYIASYDADVVKFLKKEDAIIIGKTNLDEFAMGSSTENSAFGRVKHPLDQASVPGGSSGGSAVAVASGQTVLALGTDTGGSVRQPASFTGIFGLKPTYGRISRSGVIALGSSLDQVGIFTRDIEDTGILLDALSKQTPYDATHARKDFHFSLPSEEYIRGDMKNTIIGVPKEYFTQGLDTEIKNAVNATLDNAARAGARIEHISLPSLTHALACYYIIMAAEASSNLARYDGVRYSKPANTLTRKQKNDIIDWRGSMFGPEPRRRIILGTYVLSAGYIDKYYLQAQKVRAKILQEFNEAFRRVDVIVGPTSPFFPFKAGEKTGDPLSMYLADIYTIAANLAGLPAISLPLKGTTSPAGLQLMAPHFEEERLLIVAEGMEII